MSVPWEAVAALLPVVMPVQLMPEQPQRKKKSPVSNLTKFRDMACFD